MKENEINIGSIPLQKKPVLTLHEKIFFSLHFYFWIIVQLYIKRKEGIEKYGFEKYKELSAAKNSKRAVDRYFYHKFLPEAFFEGMEIQHFWHEGTADYDYSCIWTREENQVIELRALKKRGWKVEEMVYAIEKIFLNGKDL